MKKEELKVQYHDFMRVLLKLEMVSDLLESVVEEFDSLLSEMSERIEEEEEQDDLEEQFS